MSIQNIVSAVNAVNVSSDAGKSLKARFVDMVKIYKLATDGGGKVSIPGLSNIMVACGKSDNRVIALAVVTRSIVMSNASEAEKQNLLNLVPLFVVHEGETARNEQQGKKDKTHAAYTNDTAVIIDFLSDKEESTMAVNDTRDDVQKEETVSA